VQRIKSIYDGASQVVTLLAPESEDNAIAIQKMNALVPLFGRNRYRPLYEFTSWEDPKLFGDPNLSLDSAAWTAVAKPFQRSWFNRIWIVQEASIRGDLQFIPLALGITLLITDELASKSYTRNQRGFECVNTIGPA
jgi:hypothetical protein